MTEYSNELGVISWNPGEPIEFVGESGVSDAWITNILAMPHDRVWNVNDKLRFGVLESRLGTWYASQETIDTIRRVQSGEYVKKVPETKRGDILDEAKRLVNGDRNSQYGEPYDDFLKVADALNAYGYSGPGGRKMMPRDVPFFQLLVKLSRIVQSPTKEDSWVDAAGYAACGGEVAQVEAKKND